MKTKIKFLKFILCLGDLFLMYLAILLALAIRYGDFSFLPGPQTKIFLFHFSFIHLIWLFLLFLLDFYEIPPFKKFSGFFANLVIFLFSAGAVSTIYFYLNSKTPITPKTILALDIFIFGIFLTLWRYLFFQILKVKNFREKIVIFGFRPELEELLKKYLSFGGYEILAIFVPNTTLAEKIKSLSWASKYRIFSNFQRLKEIIEAENVTSVVLALNLYENGRLTQKILSQLPLKINYINFADFYESLTKKVPLEAINEIWFLENLSRVERKIDEIFKRAFDILFSLIGLLITMILFPFIALAIKIDSPGSIFYSQKRVGKNGRTFILYKFRTMVENAEEQGPRWAQPNDTRITRIGQILRKTHLDELPQFFNILKGDLNFVGPRPERPEFVEKLKQEIPYYDIRHLVRPGFTGWAQINYKYGNSIEDAKEKLQYDLYYIKNRSFFLDLGIILKTIRVVFR